jgi:cell division protein ZapA
MEKIRTTVKIAGKEYTMASYDSEEYVRRVARYVDRKMTELSLATRLPTNALAVLTALNIADDMLKAHDEIARTRKELDQAREQTESLRAELAALRKKTGETV